VNGVPGVSPDLLDVKCQDMNGNEVRLFQQGPPPRLLRPGGRRPAAARGVSGSGGMRAAGLTRHPSRDRQNARTRSLTVAAPFHLARFAPNRLSLLRTLTHAGNIPCPRPPAAKLPTTSPSPGASSGRGRRPPPAADRLGPSFTLAVDCWRPAAAGWPSPASASAPTWSQDRRDAFFHRHPGLPARRHRRRPRRPRMVAADDVAILLSHSGESEELLRLPARSPPRPPPRCDHRQRRRHAGEERHHGIVYGPLAEACPNLLARAAARR